MDMGLYRPLRRVHPRVPTEKPVQPVELVEVPQRQMVEQGVQAELPDVAAPTLANVQLERESADPEARATPTLRLSDVAPKRAPPAERQPEPAVCGAGAADRQEVLEDLRSLLLDAASLADWSPPSSDEALARAALLDSELPYFLDMLEDAVLDEVLCDTAHEMTRLQMLRELSQEDKGLALEVSQTGQLSAQGLTVLVRRYEAFEEELRTRYHLA